MSSSPILDYIAFTDHLIHRYYSEFSQKSCQTRQPAPQSIVDDMKRVDEMFDALQIPEDSFYHRWWTEEAYYGKSPADYTYICPCDALFEIRHHIAESSPRVLNIIQSADALFHRYYTLKQHGSVIQIPEDIIKMYRTLCDQLREAHDEMDYYETHVLQRWWDDDDEKAIDLFGEIGEAIGEQEGGTF
jgi:hypothetical protein